VHEVSNLESNENEVKSDKKSTEPCSAGENESKEESDEVSSCVELADRISSSLDRKRGIGSLYEDKSQSTDLVEKQSFQNQGQVCKQTPEGNSNSTVKKRKTSPQPKPLRV